MILFRHGKVNCMGKEASYSLCDQVMDPKLSPLRIHINLGYDPNLFAIEPKLSIHIQRSPGIFENRICDGQVTMTK